MRVFIEQLEIVARHGIYDDERAEGRRFSVDLSVELPDSNADSIHDTVNYCGLADIAHHVAAENQYRLVETIARTILDQTFDRWAEVSQAEVTVRKQAFGVTGNPKWVGVSMTRERS